MENKKNKGGRPRKKPNYTYSEQTKPCENLEDELNRLWVARCKANDVFVDFIALLKAKGYSFKFSELPTKQLELIKIEQ